MTPDGTKAGTVRRVVRVSALLEDLVPGFLENRRAEVEVIDGALARSDYESLERLGHRLKGDGGGYGFPVITEIGRGLEDAARRRDAAAIRALSRELSEYLASVDVVYRG